MGDKATIISNVFMNGDDIAQVRQDLSQSLWEWGVDNALKNLLQVAPVRTSEPVLRELTLSGKKVLIKPAHPGEETHADPGISNSNSTDAWRNATPKDLPPLACAEGGVPGRDRTGTPLYRKGDDWDRTRLGTGSGTDVTVYFTSQDHLKELNLPGNRPDEVLLHELVHALRMMKGMSLCRFMPDDYDTVEEFHAILVANIYRSECGYPTLRANHFGKHALADVSDVRFYAKYKDTIDGFVGDMRVLCQSIGAVQATYNPIRCALGLRR